MLLRPGSEKPLNYWFLFSGIDKIIHILIFVVLGYAFAAAFPKIKILWFIVVMFSYSLLTEILQGAMGIGRSMELLDLFADLFGVSLGFYFYKKMQGQDRTQ